jgi:hypothetical protein
MDLQLLEFTQRALASGLRRTEIASAMQRAGWAEPDIKAALGSFADFEFAVPVPRPKPYLSAREVFIYLVLFTALVVTATNLCALIFELIDRWFPDPLLAKYAGESLGNSIRWNISALIVSFPLFIFTFRSITRAIAENPAKRSSRPRKWLTYLTLFCAGATLAGDLVTLIYNALGGELTVRFGLKAATVAIIAGGSFGFFLGDMREEEKE